MIPRTRCESPLTVVVTTVTVSVIWMMIERQEREENQDNDVGELFNRRLQSSLSG